MIAVRHLFVCAAVLSGARSAVASPQDAAGQQSLLLARLQEMPKTHPRLFGALPELADLRGSNRKAKLFAFVRASADSMLDAPVVERRKTGRRLLGVSRTCLKRVTYLAFVHRVTGDDRYARRAQQEMLAAAAFSDWNPSHFLDVAEMTAALAIGYDWLFDALDPGARTTIRDAIVTKGLRPSLAGGWWVKTTNNWNQVCHGGLSLGALAVHDSEPELASGILRRAVANLPRALGEYRPDGAYPEGPGYWVYGTTYNVLFVAALRAALGTDFGLVDAPGFLASADYYLQATGPTGLFYNYSDCGKGGGLAPAMHWFAAARKDPGLLWNEHRALDRFLAEKKPSAGGSDRLLPFALLWGSSANATAEPTRRHFVARGRTPVAMHRSGWGPGATFVGIKGGSPGANHAHMDIGSFVMDAGGVRWAADLGSQNYHSLESKGIKLWDRSQDSARWTVFRLNSLSHNTLVVDGKHQLVRGDAPIVAHTTSGEMPHTIVDMQSVYRGQLAAAMRGIGLRKDGVVLVQDELRALDRATSVRWGMLTRAKVERLHGADAELMRGGKKLTLRVLSPEGVELQVFDTATPKAAHDTPNKGTRMVGFVHGLEPGASARLVVALIPDGAAADGLRVKNLADW